CMFARCPALTPSSRLFPYTTLFRSVFLTMAPMWSIYTTGGGNSSQHLVLLGLGEPFTEELGIDNNHLYQWAYDYRDELAQVMIRDRKSTRLNSSHEWISYAVFCLKK